MDKYNKQLHESLEKEELNATYCNIFWCYSVIKSLVAHICFAFLTGIMKFSRVGHPRKNGFATRLLDSSLPCFWITNMAEEVL